MGIHHTKGWIFGYKLHITASTGFLIVPLSADFTQADVQDNQMYSTITSLHTSARSTLHGAADCGYDDHKLYNLSITEEDLSWYVQYRKYTTILQVTDCN